MLEVAYYLPCPLGGASEAAAVSLRGQYRGKVIARGGAAAPRFRKRLANPPGCLPVVWLQ